MVDETYRELTSAEKSLLDRLLAQEFPGRDEVAVQLADCHVRTIDEDGGLEIRTDSPVKASVVKYRVPTEGEAEDADGVAIHFLLHIVDAVASELEVDKEDNSRIAKVPSVDAVRIFAPT